MSIYLNNLQISDQIKHWIVLETMSPLEQEKYLEMLDLQYQLQIQQDQQQKRKAFKFKLKKQSVNSKMVQAFGFGGNGCSSSSSADGFRSRTQTNNEMSSQHVQLIDGITSENAPLITVPVALQVSKNTSLNSTLKTPNHTELRHIHAPRTSSLSFYSSISYPKPVKNFNKTSNRTCSNPTPISLDFTELSKEAKQEHMTTFLLKQQQNGYLTKHQVSEALNKRSP